MSGAADSSESMVRADARFIRAIFFQTFEQRPTVVDAEEAFRMLRRIIVRAHHVSQGAGGPAGTFDVSVVTVEMRSPMVVLVEIPDALRWASGVAALLLVAERVCTFRPRVQAKREELRAIRAIAELSRTDAQAYARDLVAARATPEGFDVLSDSSADEGELEPFFSGPGEQPRDA
jgi:hypothetical protein